MKIFSRDKLGGNVSIKFFGLTIFKYSKNKRVVRGLNNFFDIPKDANINLRVNGNNNQVIISDNSSRDYLFNIVIDGDNNVVRLGTIIKGSVNITIGNSVNLPVKNCNVKIGNDFSVTGATDIFLYENDSNFECGDDVMISHGVAIRGSDGHAVLSLQGEVLNRSQGVKIGNHVWIGQDVMISKNTQIPSGCIVGTKAVVTKKFTQENCILAGVPARVVKENISWVHELPDRC